MGTHTDEESGASNDPGSDTESELFTMQSPKMVTINDAVHGAMRIPLLCLAVIDTQEFQRLRALKQCGICNLVYPSAVHSRFEHSIGVCHWANEFLNNVGVMVPADQQLCVLLAGLCHDLGHGPFSHFWERFLLNCGVTWHHESSSVMMFRRLVENNNLLPLFKKDGLGEEHLDKICRLIKGEPAEDEEDLFLYEIIANDRNGLDVDKFEYIMRDSKQFGMSFNIDIKRIIDNVGVVKRQGRKYIGYRDKISQTLLEVFQFRAKLHNTCYRHISCIAVELMLMDALLAANDHYRIRWRQTSATEGGTEVRECKLSECHLYPEAFIKATDCIFQDLLNSTSPDLEKSRSLLESLQRRDLYTLIFKKTNLQGPRNWEDFNNRIVDALNDSAGREFNCEFRGCIKSFGIGTSWSEVYFFEKHNPTVPIKKSLDDIKHSSFIGDNVNCKDLLIFSTKGKRSLPEEELEKMRILAAKVYESLIG